METVPYTMEIPKEIKEVIDFVDQLLAKIIAKDSLTSYTELLTAAYTAFEGITDVGEEVKSEYRDEAAGYLVHKILGTLLPVKDKPLVQ